MRRISVELVAVCGIAVMVVMASFFQLFLYLRATPSGFIFPLVHNFEPDYYWYLSLMRQGWEGSIVVTSRFTPEVFPSQFINTLFPLLGIVGRLTHGTLPVVYTLSRFGFGVLLLVAGYMLAADCFGKRQNRLIAWIFMIVGGPFWYVENGVVRQLGEFWTGFDPIMRMAWLPHHMAANALLILSLVLFVRWHTTAKRNTLVVAVLAGAGATWLNPASGMTIAFAIGVVVAFLLATSNSRYSVVLGAITMIASILLPLGILYRLTNSVFPWTAFRDWERFVQYPIDAKGFLGVLGVVGIVAMVSLPVAIKQSRPLWWGIVAWFVWPFLGLGVLSRWLPFSNGRFLQSASYIPAALLAALGVSQLGRRKIVEFLVVGFIILFSLPNGIASVVRQEQYVKRNAGNPLIFVSNDAMRAMDWLAHNSVPEDVALAPPAISSLIPAMSGNRVLLGHPTFTYDPAKKEEDVAAFYRFDSMEKAKIIIAQYNVSYIWMENVQVPTTFTTELSLERIYTNPSVSLYTVK